MNINRLLSGVFVIPEELPRANWAPIPEKFFTYSDPLNILLLTYRQNLPPFLYDNTLIDSDEMLHVIITMRAEEIEQQLLDRLFQILHLEDSIGVKQQFHRLDFYQQCEFLQLDSYTSCRNLMTLVETYRSLC